MAILAGAVVALSSGGPALAARDLPPAKGGTTYSLGMPPVWKGRAGVEGQWFRPQNDRDLALYLDAGLARDLGSPVVGIGALRLEGYAGFRGEEFDGGGRLLYEIPSFHLGAGVDWNARDDVADFLLTLDLPLRRGGVFGRGSTLAVRWLPARDQTVGLGVNVPLWGRNIGATRPRTDSVRLEHRSPQRLAPASPSPALAAALDDLAERARWVARLSQPFAEPEGADAGQAMAADLAVVRAHADSTDARFPDGHTLAAEIDAWHEALDLSFSLALGADGPTPAGRRYADRARATVLDEILLPYNALLGQRKTDDSLVGMIAVAQTEFAAWALSAPEITEGNARDVLLVLQTLCDVMEETRAELRRRWEDSRFVWLPLQLALRPGQHDSQDELDAIVGKAAGRPFEPANRVWYVVNEQFQWEMARSVRLAEDYHVLWIHDFRGRNGEGRPDAIAYAHVLNYLTALTERAAALDERGTMPQYFILLDQHYFEINKSRLWMRLLSDPLGATPDLPDGCEDWEQELRAQQGRLRDAVAGSRLLRLARSQYGEAWLRNLIKVHVNITNPADPSFWSWHVAGILPIPDNMMRDHRKIAFYDVSEADPYRGMAMFTGMGIGEHYVGPGWEDRALMIQGPGALAVKDAARGLLEAQGLDPREIPHALRRQEKPADYGRKVQEALAAAPDWLDDPGRVLQLHNETGFHDKPIDAAKAVLYSLMPPGSVLLVPDSLWQSYVYASLLAGSAQRGCRVLVIAPTADSAPSAAAPTLARAHGLLGRLIVFGREMDPVLARSGGLLKVGLYAPRHGVGDLAGRIEQAEQDLPDWTGRVFPGNPRARAEVLNARAMLDSLGFATRYITADTAAVKPKIHLKANFMASRTAWDRLGTRPEMAPIVRGHIRYLASQLAGRDSTGQAPDVRRYPQELADGWLRLIRGLLADCTPAERDELAYFLTVGSVNMDYRSMVMDGEVMVTLGGWQALYGFMDFMLLPGLCEWIDTQDELDALLPPPSGLTRGLAGLMKLAL